jgi:phosphatidylglycerophosphatase A
MGRIMKKLLITFGGLGLLPGMPGTYASLAAAVIFGALLYISLPVALMASAAIVLVTGILGVILTPWAEEYFQKKDPSSFVLDEVVGQLTTLIIVFLTVPLLPAIATRPIAHIAACFVFFRTFDVAKPWPIRNIEKLHGGAGVVLDDVLGALYAAVVTLVMIGIVRLLVGAKVYDAQSTAMVDTIRLWLG